MTYELRRRGALCRSGPFDLVLGLMREQVGGEVPITITQGGLNDNNTVEFKPFGVVIVHKKAATVSLLNAMPM